MTPGSCCCFQLVVFNWSIVSSAESRSWKWNKMFRNQKQFFHPTKKYFSDSLTQQTKNIFRFLDPNKKKFLCSSTQTKKNIFQIPRPKTKKNSFLDSSTQTKKIFLRFLDPTKKNIFQIPRPKQKKYFFILDPNKKNIFGIPRPKQKKYFYYYRNPKKAIFSYWFPNPCKQGISMTGWLLAAVLRLFSSASWSIVSLSAESRLWKMRTKCFRIRNSSFI